MRNKDRNRNDVGFKDAHSLLQVSEFRFPFSIPSFPTPPKAKIICVKIARLKVLCGIIFLFKKKNKKIIC